MRLVAVETNGVVSDEDDNGVLFRRNAGVA